MSLGIPFQINLGYFGIEIEESVQWILKQPFLASKVYISRLRPCDNHRINESELTGKGKFGRTKEEKEGRDSATEGS